MRPDLFLATIGRGSNGSNALEVTEDRAAVTAESQDNIINRVNNISQYGPSWHYVPGIGVAGTAYAEVPGSALGDLAFTRASSKTRTNAAGVVETIGSNVPPHDYRNADGTLSTFPRLNLEPQRTNSMIHSENVASALTYQANTTVTANTGVSPDGNTTADTVLFALSSYRLRSFTIAANTSYSASLFFKNINFAGTETINLNVSDGVYGPITATIQPANGTATFTRNTSGWSSVSGVVQNYGNGWYRVAVSGTSIGGGTGWYEISSQVSKSALFWGLQFEQSAAYPTSYIPTTTAAVTRLADAASKTGVSSLIGQTEGTMFAEVNLINIVDGLILQISSSSSNRIGLFYRGSTNDLQIFAVNGGSFTVVINSKRTVGRYKIAAAYKLNDYVFYINGVQVDTDTSSNVPACSTIDLGEYAGFNFSNRIDQAALFPTRLTNAQLAQLTTL